MNMIRRNELRDGITEFHSGSGVIWGWYMNVPRGRKVSELVVEAAKLCGDSSGMDPMAIYARDIPTGAEEFIEIDGMCLLQVSWMPMNAIMVVTAKNQIPFSRLGKEGVEVQHTTASEEGGICG